MQDSVDDIQRNFGANEVPATAGHSARALNTDRDIHILSRRERQHVGRRWIVQVFTMQSAELLVVGEQERDPQFGALDLRQGSRHDAGQKRAIGPRAKSVVDLQEWP